MSQKMDVLAGVSPQSVAAAAKATSSYFHVADASRVLALLRVGDDGGGSITVTWLQAKTVEGGSAKELNAGTFQTSAAFTANDTVHKIADGDPALGIDKNNGFAYVAFEATVTGGTGALLSGEVVGVDLQYA